MPDTHYSAIEKGKNKPHNEQIHLFYISLIVELRIIENNLFPYV